MERLTKEGKFCDVIECELTPGGSFCERGTCTERRLWERLSSIEDILGDDYDLDRLRELVEADREGRCVVLPCKVGDTIYDISLAEIKESKVISISFIASKSTYHVSICAENYRHAITLDIEIGDFGKTVFLTRKEAEAVLEEMKNG